MNIEREYKYELRHSVNGLIDKLFDDAKFRQFSFAHRAKRIILDIYYDTPESMLVKSGLSLRLRNEEGKYKVTLKSLSHREGNRFIRSEYEKRFQVEPILKVLFSLQEMGAISNRKDISVSSLIGSLFKDYNFTERVRIVNHRNPVRIRNREKIDIAEASVDNLEYIIDDHNTAITEIEIELLDVHYQGHLKKFISLFEEKHLDLLKPINITKYQRGLAFQMRKLHGKN